MSEQTWVRLGPAASLTASAVLVVVVGAQTVAGQQFLRGVGWSPVHRTPVDWPSLLALAPGGWVVSASFALAGVATILLAGAVFASSVARAALASGGVIAVGVGMLGVTFPTDLPGAAWHGTIHDVAYNVILAGTMLSLLTARATGIAWRRTVPRQVALPLLVILIVCVSLTTADAFAQLVRNGVLACILGWLTIVAVAILRGPLVVQH